MTVQTFASNARKAVCSLVPKWVPERWVAGTAKTIVEIEWPIVEWVRQIVPKIARRLCKAT